MSTSSVSGTTTYTAFAGSRRIASGPLWDVAHEVKEAADAGGPDFILIFEDSTGQQLDLDLRGTVEDVVRRYRPTEPQRGPGRPKLGVVAREVTLLPRQWEWLGRQAGGASVAIRRLVHEAMKSGETAAETRRARDAAYRFISSMAGNLPGFEEAARALYAGDFREFERRTESWPPDISHYAHRLAGPGLGDSEPAASEG